MFLFNNDLIVLNVHLNTLKYQITVNKRLVITISNKSIKKMSIINGHARWAFNFNTWRPSLDDLRIATSCIQLEEKARLSKFIFRDDFIASLIGRLLMRKFIKKATGLEYNSIKFERDCRGKPFLPNSIIDFNVSHQGSYSVLAGCLHQDTKIGVDVMKIEYSGGKKLSEFFRLMNRNFSRDEWIYINNGENDLTKIESFMRNWCLKESYVKNIGVGITVNLEKISFDIKTKILSQKPTMDSTLKVDDVLMKDWTFEESLIDKDHCVAVSLKSLNKLRSVNEFEIIDFKELITDYKPLIEIDDEYCQQILKKEYKR